MAFAEINPVMVDFTTQHIDIPRTASQKARPYKSVQAWKSNHTNTAPKTGAAINTVMKNLEKAAQGRVGTFDLQLENAHAYAGSTQTTPSTAKDEEYQFHDVIDVINPLHHLPLVGYIYREITGDEIRPVSQIIGGSIYGGPIGAVTSTVNAISQVQTGKDVGGHVMEMAGFGDDEKTENTIAQKQPSIPPTTLMGFSDTSTMPYQPSGDLDNPVEQLNNAANALGKQANGRLDTLPGSTLSFVNLSEPSRAHRHIEAAEGRTAGKQMVDKEYISYKGYAPAITEDAVTRPKTNLDFLPAREALTTISLSPMLPRQKF